MSSPHLCLDDDALLELARGQCGAERAQALLNEAERCPDCMLLVAEAGRAVAEGAGDGVEPSPWLQRAAMLPNGVMLAARFSVIGLLGRGGMGEVYEVLDTELGERVALKTIAPALACEVVNIERFRQEVRLARKVVDPHVCRVLEFGRHDTQYAAPIYFLTMELLRGELLSQRLRTCGPMPVVEVLTIATQVAKGLKAIHDEGVLHRDIKTNNIMLCDGVTARAGQTTATGLNPDPQTRAVLLDFGVARSLVGDAASLVPSGLVGTPDYMAPEQLRGAPLSPAADVYALGVVLFQLLTGRMPFEAEQPFARALQRLHSEPPAPSTMRPEIPKAIDALVRRCLDPDPRQRPASAREFLDAVLALEVQLANGTPAGRLSVAPSIRRRSRLSGALLLALLAFLMTLALGTLAAKIVFFHGSEHGAPAPSVETTTTRAPAPPVPNSIEPVVRPEIVTNGLEPSQATPAPAPATTNSTPHLPARRAAIKRPPTAAPPLAGSVTPARCSPPYYYDADGFQVFRKECL